MNHPIFYSAPNARTGDVIPKYIDGKYQVFYLKNWKDRSAPGVIPGWHRMETDDMLHMTPETPIGVVGGTGDLFYHDGVWHLFACIFPEGKQFVTHYISRDGSLDNWEYIEEDTFGPDGVIYHKSDWRDPRIEYDPENDEFKMLLCARVNDPHSQGGCVGVCVSKDLHKWEYRQPEYYPRRFNGACECPDTFVMGDWEYLTFSSYTNLFGHYYVKRRVGTKAWKLPGNHRLESRGFYAPKTAGDGTERYLFGWLPTKEDNVYGFWPDKMETQDYRTWDWGGGMVIHRLGQTEDGELTLSLPQSRKNAFKELTENTFTFITPDLEAIDGGVRATADNAQSIVRMQQTPGKGYLHVDILAKDAQQAGVILRADRAMGNGYYLYVEPEKGRLVYRSWLRMYEEGGKTFPYDVEMEVPVRKRDDGRYKLEILMEDTAATAYVNGETALSFRMYDIEEGDLGLFILGPGEFTDIRLYK